MDVQGDQERIRSVQNAVGFYQDRTILTSRDELAQRMMGQLPARGLADGFPGQLIPILFDSGSVDAIVEPAVGETTHLHSHRDSSGFHLVMHGKVLFRRPDAEQDPEVELTSGDWAYVPAGMEYEIRILENPVRMLYKHR